MAVAGAAILMAGCNKDDTPDISPYPDKGTLTLTTDWSARGAGTDIPGSYVVAIDDWSQTLSSETNTLDNSFDPKEYRVYVYNTPDNITVSDLVASVKTVAAPASMSGTFVTTEPGWLFSAATDVEVLKDKVQAFTVVMQQQVRELTLVVKPSGDTAGDVAKITAVLNGVAGAWDIDVDQPSGAEVQTFVEFTQTGLPADDNWYATVRLLGIAGPVQTLEGSIGFTTESGLEDMGFDKDLHNITEFAEFNTGKKTPLALAAQLVKAYDYIELGDFDVIPGWQQGEEDIVTAQVEVMAGQLQAAITILGLENATGLTLKGTLDQRDFDYLNESLPSLLTLDIKDVDVAAYGSYPANEIPEYALYGKTGLETIVLPESITAIGKSAFGNCGDLTGVLKIPDNVTTIAEQAFFNCGLIGALELGERLQIIGAKAFEDCGFISNLKIPDNVTMIGDLAFYNCYFGGTIELGEELQTIGEEAFLGCSFTGDLKIPDNVTTIAKHAFLNCDFRGILELGEKLQTINEQAFAGCIFTGTLKIPEKMTDIGRHTFYNCMFESPATLELGEGLQTIGEEAFYGCGFIGDLKIPDNVTTIADRAFYDCTFDGTLELGEGLRTIGEYVFYGCDFTGTLKIPDQITEIPSFTFSNCISGGALEFGEKLRTISEYAFPYCDFTGDLEIPDNVTTIGEHAFQFSTFTGGFKVSDNVTTIADNIFRDCKFGGTLDLGKGLQTIGGGAFSNGAFSGDLKIPDNVTTIGGYAFYGCKFSGTLELGEGLRTIGDYVFYGCDFTGDLNIPDQVTAIGTSTFSNGGFRDGKLYMKESVQAIGDLAFYSCAFAEIHVKWTTPIGYSQYMFDDGIPVFVPEGSKETYEAVSTWSTRHTFIEE